MNSESLRRFIEVNETKFIAMKDNYIFFIKIYKINL